MRKIIVFAIATFFVVNVFSNELASPEALINETLINVEKDKEEYLKKIYIISAIVAVGFLGVGLAVYFAWKRDRERLIRSKNSEIESLEEKLLEEREEYREKLFHKKYKYANALEDKTHEMKLELSKRSDRLFCEYKRLKSEFSKASLEMNRDYKGSLAKIEEEHRSRGDDGDSGSSLLGVAARGFFMTAGSELAGGLFGGE